MRLYSNTAHKKRKEIRKTIDIIFDCNIFHYDTTHKSPIFYRTDVLNRIFKRIMQDEEVTQYFLRHTFSTTCQQYVRPDIVDVWMGDSSERLVGRVYTHFSDKFLREQMNLVEFFA